MRDEAILNGLASASRAIRNSESSHQDHESEERQNARRALICADAAANEVARRWQAEPEAKTMAQQQAAANRPHYAENLDTDWAFIVQGADTHTAECLMIVEGQSMARSYECRRGDVDPRANPCLSCFFASGHVGDVMSVPEPADRNDDAHTEALDPVAQATAALRHLREAALATPDTTCERVLLAIGDCAHFVVQAVERGQAERTWPISGDDAIDGLADAHTDLQETLGDRLGSPER